jgi:hypothetical protein
MKRNIFSFFSDKGFLFTISVILFASTLVFFTMSYANNNVSDERMIITSLFSSVPNFLADNISSNVLSILDFDTSVTPAASSAKIRVRDSLNKRNNVALTLLDYNSFLYSVSFARNLGVESIDFSSMTDNSYEVLYGDEFVYSNNYSNNTVLFYPLNASLPSSIDINLYSVSDLNSIEWVKTAGSTPVVITYFDDSNYFTLVDSVDLSSTSSLILIYDDSNTGLFLGSSTSPNETVRIDSNSSNYVEYIIDLNYSLSKTSLPIDLNLLTTYAGSNTTISSLVGISK